MTKSEETGLPRPTGLAMTESVWIATLYQARNDREKYKMIFFASFQWLVLYMMSPITENENH
jgi:hypothetical protein